MAKKYEGYLLCTDFDGTFARSEENLRAVRHFQENGGLFTIASGRTYRFLQSFSAQFVPNAPGIVLNGSLVCDNVTGQPIHHVPLKRDNLLATLDEMSRVGVSRSITLHGGADDSEEWRPEDRILPSERLAGLPEPWYKVVLVQQNPQDTLTLRDRLRGGYGDRYRIDRSWPEGVEIQAPDSGKGACLQWLKARLNGRIHTTIGVGDYENDLSLVRAADIGYAVANAIEEVRAAANRVTVHYADHAIARIIDEL